MKIFVFARAIFRSVLQKKTLFLAIFVGEIGYEWMR
jgi:hypothetical protein